jgi:PD-(D/E)XK endonuclease
VSERAVDVPDSHGPADGLGKLEDMEHPKAIGDRTTLAIMLALRQAGYLLLVPFGENSRYDLVIDDGLRLARVQCKTGRLRSGAVLFNTCSSYAHHPNPKLRRRDYSGEIDFFGVYCAETGGVYLVPIEDASLRSRGALRVVPARNRQTRGIRLAASYEIANFRS